MNLAEWICRLSDADYRACATGHHGSAKLTCTIGFNAPKWAEIAGTLVRNEHAIREHFLEESAGFAVSIAKRFGAI